MVLARRVAQSLHLDIPPSTETRKVVIMVTELRTHSQCVKLGISAPADINIVREELLKEADHAEG